MPCTVVSIPLPLRLGASASGGAGVTRPSVNCTKTVSVSAPADVCEAKIENGSVGRNGFGLREKSHTAAGVFIAVPTLLLARFGYGSGSIEGAWGERVCSVAPQPYRESRFGRVSQACIALHA